MRNILLISAMALTMSIPSEASADIYCGGDAPVLKLLTYRDGAVSILTAWRADYMVICNLTVVWKGVQPATCFAWMSKIAGAISTGKRTGFWYDASVTTCSAIPTYAAAPSPVYVDVAP